MVARIQTFLCRCVVFVRDTFEIPVAPYCPVVIYGILMPFYPSGDLFEYFLTFLSVDEEWIARVAYSMLMAIRNFHGHGLVHNDIQLETFLVEARRWPYLADVGAILEMDADGTVEGDPDKIGAYVYRAPEQWAGGSCDGRSVARFFSLPRARCLSGCIHQN
jgi:serine/threonine protein kinase